MAQNPGMLYVTMQPKPGLSLDQFHEWYNNEHGPTRLRLPQIFSNGLRYAATDAEQPHFLAAYDVTSMHHLDTPTYTSLRENRSPREAQTIGQVDVKRYFYDLVSERKAPSFRPIEQLADGEAEGQVLVAVENTVTAVEGAEQALDKWYEEEHIPMLSKVPGWLRTRRFRTATSLDKEAPLKYLILHEYTKENGLGGPEYKAATSTKWREEIFEKVIASKHRRTYSLFYVFGPGPRDLASLAKLPAEKAFVSSDARIRTTPHNGKPVLQAFIPVKDGLSIPYQLEGNPDPKAPTIAFCNSLLTSLQMWDPLVDILKEARPEFRILRFDTRGRHTVPEPPVAVTLDMVSDDLAAVLSALRIEKLHALIGVSMGGASTLKFALKYPGKVDRFIACDFNVNSSEANTQAWKDRIAVAESVGEDGTPGIRKLAAMTVERWFHPHTMTAKINVASWMTEMVADNDIQGFRYGCQALWDYNMRGELKGCTVPGLLVVGEGDGKGALVKAMESFKDSVGEKGAELKIVPEAGHLPMCESPQGFWDAISGFL
ncbi:alpha/beta-hydrolase [Cryphonectria parasitica EP155]|uniref:Alpha/beta-hydrolase n=1 Tax=Cryphonectria parasitica (strain ATCC 38755 / EP155) TaxID=660469 RepID=A0A9P5CQU7_CRYP1|nr:alpha/beta-hydrolase [Cryphonectria parasitica EP155]KAF3766445.1 alpha/beta-hydrolase [Cryphonectria parasitica EP155]